MIGQENVIVWILSSQDKKADLTVGQVNVAADQAMSPDRTHVKLCTRGVARPLALISRT